MLSTRSVTQQRSVTARLVVILAIIMAGGLPAPLHAAPPAQTFGGDQLNPFAQLFPELKYLPAPTWLKEGLRVTYYVQSATIAQVPDEDGSAGAGYLQNDVVAKDTKNVVVSTSYYLDGGNGKVTPSGVFGAEFIPGVGDWWLNPEVLVDAEKVANDELAVVHMPYTVAGQEYQAVRFEYRADGAVTVWVFEEATGLLIFYRSTIGTDETARRTSSEAFLVNRRMIKLPWQGKRAPTWLKKGQTYEYQGVYALDIAGSPSGSFDATSTVDITSAQSLWTRYYAALYLGGLNQGQSTRVTGVYQLSNALWLPAPALTANVRKPLLDRDPVTGVETSYTRSRGVVLIEERGPLHYSSWTYDGNTGKLLAVHNEVQIGISVNTTDLELQR